MAVTDEDVLFVVLDTNVLYSALRSGGNPAVILDAALYGELLQPCISNALLLEYEATLINRLDDINQRRVLAGWSRLNKSDIEHLLDDYVRVSDPYAIVLTARPVLPDPDDEKVLDLVLRSGATLVTGNRKDFAPAIDPFKIELVTCADMVKRLTR